LIEVPDERNQPARMAAAVFKVRGAVRPPHFCRIQMDGLEERLLRHAV